MLTAVAASYGSASVCPFGVSDGRWLDVADAASPPHSDIFTLKEVAM